mmetsp:Transcript_26354/g.105492  ORF Transcript_26354/g.105492 Transcript_26354/m.105492 type:complete len:162 (+) Transcript_26354:647-1132(+)
MLLPLYAQPTPNDRAVDEAQHLLLPGTRIRDNSLAIMHAPNTTHRLEIYETVPELVADAHEALTDHHRQRHAESTYCACVLRTLVDVEHYFLDPGRLVFFGDPLRRPRRRAARGGRHDGRVVAARDLGARAALHDVGVLGGERRRGGHGLRYADGSAAPSL